MKIRAKHLLLKYFVCLSVGTSLSFLFLPCVQAAVNYQKTISETASLAKEAPQPFTLLDQKHTFTYRLEGRPDPFLPFLTNKSQTNPDEIVDSHQKLTGMQLFEPGQLTLVALVRTPDQKFAMVQDVSGKGYVIREGTKIGRRGVVTAIIPNKVVIQETAITRSGRKLTNKIIMVLRKEEKRK